jgi:lipoprotein-releasing system permease protein
MNRVDIQRPQQRMVRARRNGGGTSPFSYFEWMLAGRYLRARRKEGFISVIAGFSLAGIALGVATLIIVMAVMNGFREELMGKILGFNSHLTIYGAGPSLDTWRHDVDLVKKLTGVTRATPVVKGQALASAAGAASGVAVIGIRPTDLKSLTLVSKSLEPQAVQNFKGDSSILVGERLANAMGLLPGMHITLVAPRGNVTPFGVTPRAKRYQIVGTFNVGMSEYDNTVVFLPMEEAQAYFNLGSAVSGIEVMIDNPEHIAGARANIEGVVPGARIIDWQQAHETFFGALQVERTVMFLILSLIIVVAAFNIISGMIMMVKDKTRDIAILRTMGATSGTILRVFLISGSAIGILGTFIGFVLGVLFCWNIESIRQFLIWMTGADLFPQAIYFLSRLPAKMETEEVAVVVLAGLTISILATIYPAWRAARLDPVEALRYE